jgi:hypothetical protein
LNQFLSHRRDTPLVRYLVFPYMQLQRTVPTDASVGTFRTGGMPKIERFAVAVWPSQVKDEYWVGVGLYWSAGWEWFDLHLTDDHYYGNLWKTNIAGECKKVK